MHDWFGLLDLKKFAAKYALDIAQEELCKSLEAKHQGL